MLVVGVPNFLTSCGDGLICPPLEQVGHRRFMTRPLGASMALAPLSD